MSEKGDNSRLADRSADGDTIGFSFFDATNTNVFPGIFPGGASNVIVVRTNATNFGPGFMTVTDDEGTTVPGFAPAVVPEPATVLLVGSGFVGLGLSLLRRSRD